MEAAFQEHGCRGAAPRIDHGAVVDRGQARDGEVLVVHVEGVGGVGKKAVYRQVVIRQLQLAQSRVNHVVKGGTSGVEQLAIGAVEIDGTGAGVETQKRAFDPWARVHDGVIGTGQESSAALAKAVRSKRQVREQANGPRVLGPNRNAGSSVLANSRCINGARY